MLVEKIWVHNFFITLTYMPLLQSTLWLRGKSDIINDLFSLFSIQMNK